MTTSRQQVPAELRDAEGVAVEVIEALAVAAPVGLALFDGATFAVRWTNRAYLDLLDEPFRTSGVTGHRLEIFAPNAKVVPALLASVSATGRPESVQELDYRGLARGVTTWRLTLRPVERGAGQPRDVLVALVDVTDQVAARRRAEVAAAHAREAEQAAQRGLDRLTRLLEITTALAAARTHGEAASALFEGVRRSVGAVTGVLLVPRAPGLLELVASHGLEPSELEGLRHLPLDAPLPTAVAAARGEPIWLEELAGAEVAYPGLVRLPSILGKARAVAALPMRAGGAPCGVLGLAFREPRAFDAGERAFLLALAEQGALALERAALLDALQRERGRLALSQELTSALSSAHTVAEVAAAVFEKGLQAFGARAGMLALQRDGRLAVEHLFGYRPAQQAAFRDIDPSAPVAVAEAFRTAAPIWVESRGEMMLRYPALIGRLDPGHGAWAALPLESQGGPTGVLGLSFAEERTFDAGERALAVSLSRKCAQALERARLYESEQAARAEAERASALQERLVAIVGHDLRTPLAAITLSAQSLQRRGTLGDREAAAVARVCGGAARMAGIIHDLLDFARTRQGQGIPVRLAALDAGALCRQVVAEARGAHPEARVEEDCQDGLTVQGDADRLHQALANLLGNAIQHGGGLPIEVAARRDGDGVRLSVHNLGPAIAPDLLPHVFEPFRRGTDRGEGIGLGLHIVSEIVKAHGGRVEVSSSPEAGTTFAVRLAASGEAASG